MNNYKQILRTVELFEELTHSKGNPIELEIRLRRNLIPTFTPETPYATWCGSFYYPSQHKITNTSGVQQHQINGMTLKDRIQGTFEPTMNDSIYFGPQDERTMKGAAAHEIPLPDLEGYLTMQVGGQEVKVPFSAITNWRVLNNPQPVSN